MALPEVPTRKDAARFSRIAETPLPAARLLASAGTAAVTLRSVAEVEAFLIPTTAEETLSRRMAGFINYVDPQGLEQWVRETISDGDLADSLRAVIGTGNAFGVMVPEMKQLLADRLAQYRAVLEAASGEDEPSGNA